MYVGSQGTFCSGTLIARDLVLTAAHCIHAGEMYKLVEKGSDRQPVFRDVTTVRHHPQFSLKSMLAHRATADVALMKLAAPLNRLVAPLLPPRPRVTPGESFVVRGYGTSVLGDGNSGGRLREASLIATGQPGNLQLRLVDGASSSTRPGMGACTGTAAPVYQRTSAGLAIVGVVSWSTAPKNEWLRWTNGGNPAGALSHLDRGPSRSDGKLASALIQVETHACQDGSVIGPKTHKLAAIY